MNSEAHFVRRLSMAVSMLFAGACWQGPDVGDLVMQGGVGGSGGTGGTGGSTAADGGMVDAGMPFSKIYTAILKPNCTTAQCHVGNPPPYAPMSLEAEVAYASIVDRPSTQVPTLMRVKPNDLGQSYLLLKLLGTARNVGGTDSQMPLFQPPLPPADIAAIQAWIA